MSASLSSRNPGPAHRQLLASGNNRAFVHSLPTSAPDRIWQFWTTPDAWKDWDHGLKEARLEGPMTLGATG
jgi:hypothetical protein